jgi:hypothetical protein
MHAIAVVPQADDFGYYVTRNVVIYTGHKISLGGVKSGRLGQMNMMIKSVDKYLVTELWYENRHLGRSGKWDVNSEDRIYWYFCC